MPHKNPVSHPAQGEEVHTITWEKFRQIEFGEKFKKFDK